MSSSLNHVDLCFVIDTTGSMGAFITAAKQKLTAALTRLSKEGGIDLHVGMVEYRDHPPEENSFITKVYHFIRDMKEMQKRIDGLTPGGGGDAPEAVYRGVNDACQKLLWRKNSARFIILVGDAPPHGFETWLRSHTFPTRNLRGGDHWPDACPSGLSIESVTAELERKAITLHAVQMGGYPLVEQSFMALACGSGGSKEELKAGRDVIEVIVESLQKEFGNLAFDQEVFTHYQKSGQSPDPESIAKELSTTRLKVVQSLSRLGRRELLSGSLN